MKKMLIVLMSLIVTSSQAAAIAVSVTGTADSTKMGYEEGQSYTFTWVVNDGYTGTDWDNFKATENNWTADYTYDPLLWTSVSGDGLVGTYSRPSNDTEAPYDFMLANSQGFSVRAGNELSGDDSNNMGLTVDGVELAQVSASNLNIGTMDYSQTSFVNPATWLGSYIGTHAQSGGIIEVNDTTGRFGFITFTATSVSVAAIPELASGTLLGLAGFIAFCVLSLGNRFSSIKGKSR